MKPKFKPPERYVLYANAHRDPDVYTRTWVPIFFDPDHAHKWLKKMVGNDEFEMDGNVLKLPDGVTIRCDRFDEVLNAPETDWELPRDYAHNCLRFRRGSWDEDHSSSAELEETVTDDGEVIKTKKPKPEKPKKASRPDGYVTIGDWCKKWKIKPLHARQALRALVEKPEYGWAFDPKREAEIKKICGA